MNLDLHTLLVIGAALMFGSALASSAPVAMRRRPRGHSIWSMAQALAFVGLVSQALRAPADEFDLLGQVLVLQWPMTVVIGLRRFHARQPLRGRPSFDWLVLSLALLVTAIGAGSSGELHAAAFGVSFCALLAYGSLVCRGTPALLDSAAMRMLVAAWFAIAAVGLIWIGLALGWGGDLSPLRASTLLVVPVGLLMAWLAPQLSAERVERGLLESQRRLRFLANIDMLTRVPNRRHFAELAQRALSGSQGAASVLMFDIDHFKQINDLLGHAAGDRALRVVSRCVQETLRGQDVAGRYGGDEFALLLPQTSMSDAMAVAGRIVTRAQALAEEQAVPRLSLSFGVVQLRPDETLDEALRRADGALYEAKRQGRGRAVSAYGDEETPVFVESRRLGLTPL